MAEYRYLLRDVFTGDLIGEVPFENTSYGDILNSPGAFSGRIGLHQPIKVQDLMANALTLLGDGRLTLFVERNGVLVWGGFLWTSESNLDEEVCTINGEGYLSYFRRRLIAQTLTYTQIDQALIAKDLIDKAQATYGYGNVGVTTSDVTAVGVLRDRVYDFYETKWYGESLEQLAAVDGGFDFRFEPRWSGNSVQVRFLVTYPATGRSTDYIFEIGVQTSRAGVKRDATTLANRVVAVGATLEAATNPLTTVSWNIPALGSQPLFDDVVNFTDVNNAFTLQQHGDKRIQRGRKAVVIPDIDVDPPRVPTLGSYAIGDIVTVRGTVGFERLNDVFRITERSVAVDDTGAETSSLTFAKQELFA